MSTAVFASVYLCGACVLALWIDFRLAALRPASWQRLGIAVVAVMGVDDIAPMILRLGPRLLGVMAVGLPALIVTFLVCIWMLRMMRAAMPA
jgi:hypothetical protein